MGTITKTQDTQRSKVFSLLKRYNHLTTEQIVDYMYLVFDIRCNKSTARVYRAEYEAQHVGLVVDVGVYKPFTNTPKNKVYAHNGDAYTYRNQELKGAVPYKTPFWHGVRLFFRGGTVQKYNEYFKKLEALKTQEV